MTKRLMQFFTLEWWGGRCDDDAFASYRAHYDRICGVLPSGLRRLHGEISLHDAKLEKLELDTKARRLEIQFMGCDDLMYETRKCYPLITLRYNDVEKYRSMGEYDKGLGGPYGYGDLGYDEVDVTDHKMFVHRMIFSNGIEVEITFGGFELKIEEIPARRPR